MSEGRGRERRWLRPLGLFGLVLAFSVGQPLVLVGIPFALLAFLAPGRSLGGLLAGTVVFALVFAGEPGTGLWYLERGWAIVVAGGFVGATLVWPREPFLPRALLAVAGAATWCGAILVALGGWGRAQTLVAGRIDQSAEATLELFLSLRGDGDGYEGFSETLTRTAEIQGILFPALVALATVAALGVGWWAHVRVTRGSDGALEPLRRFTFPDPLIWVLIAALALLLGFGWSEGLGRAGANVAVFMGGLYALRGAGVLLFVVGRVSVPGAILVAVAAVLAPPLVLAGAMAVGVSDSWFDLRARRASQDDTID